MGIFSIFATPLGYVMRWIYELIPSYFLTMFVFTLLVRLLVFPLSIKGQKSQADRARLAPRLERIQKKYANDRQKMQQKQQELYEKEGVSMTGGCLPMLVQMVVLMSIIAVIYKPLTYVQQMPAETINTCVSAITDELDEKKDAKLISQYSEKSYYREMYLLQSLDTHAEKIEAKLLENDRSVLEAAQVVDQLEKTKEDFSFFGVSLLQRPSHTGIRPNWLWLIAIASGAAALLSSIISMRYSKASMSQEQQQAAGCTSGPMMYGMPLFSLVIAFTVPGGVAVYWVFSNLLGIVQTVILNTMYSPAKARAQAEAEYAERRRKKAEDKARLKAARLEEQAAWQREENEKRAAAKGQGKKKPAKPATSDAPDAPAEKDGADVPAEDKGE
ncbi:MAG: membrane protein insertase YidC [Clostridia bacterium]|nr:membrane protein insertase YidC [Clostridia bacterium]